MKKQYTRRQRAARKPYIAAPSGMIQHQPTQPAQPFVVALADVLGWLDARAARRNMSPPSTKANTSTHG